MSLSGKLLRGIGWHKFRDVDGEYPDDIKGDPHKMEEINFYLDFVKTRDAEKVSKILEKVMLHDLNNKPALLSLEASKLLELPETKETKSKGKN